MDCLQTKHRIILLLWSLSFAALDSSAQTFIGSVFNQNGTQRDYYIQQIAALTVYAKDLKSGYKTVSNGLNTIRDAKNGEFKLHQDYFNSLSTVNPSIKKEQHVNDILQMQTDISATFSKMLAATGQNPYITADEKKYLNTVHSNVQKDCLTDVNELEMVITDGKVQMKDDERMKRIDNIYLRMKDRYEFSRTFCNQALALCVQKAHHNNDIKTLQQLYNTNKS